MTVIALTLTLLAAPADDALPHLDAAMAAIASQNLPAAREALSAALAVDPDNIDALWGLAVMEKNAGKYRKAIAHLRKILKLDDYDDDARVALADALWQQGHTPQALQTVRAVLEENPEFDNALELQTRITTGASPGGPGQWKPLARADIGVGYDTNVSLGSGDNPAVSEIDAAAGSVAIAVGVVYGKASRPLTLIAQLTNKSSFLDRADVERYMPSTVGGSATASRRMGALQTALDIRYHELFTDAFSEHRERLVAPSLWFAAQPSESHRLRLLAGLDYRQQFGSQATQARSSGTGKLSLRDRTFALVQTVSETIGGIGTGERFLDSSPFPLDPLLGPGTSGPSAIGIDLVSGFPIVGGYFDGSGGDARTLFSFADRFGGSTHGKINVLAAPDIGAAVRFTTLATDSASRVVYGSDTDLTGGVRLFSIDLDTLAFVSNSAWPNSAVVVDMVVAGPQPLEISTHVAYPGDVVTVRGLGFAGSNRDEVFVQGVKAVVLGSTPTSVTFQVPESLRVLDGIDDAWVTVRSYGRLSGPAHVKFNIASRTPAHVANVASGRFCSPCTVVQLVPGEIEIAPVVINDPAGVYGVIAYEYGGTTRQTITLNGPDRATAMRSARTMVGTSGNQWYSMTIPSVVIAGFIIEPPRLLSNNPGAGTYGAFAVSADQATLAVDTGQGIRLFSATTFQPLTTAAITPNVNPIRALAFSRDGKSLIVGGDNAFDVITLGTAAVAPVQIVTPCPAGTPRLLTLSPHGPGGELTAVLTPATNMISSASIAPGANGFTFTCLKTMPTRGTITAAAVSPLGDNLAFLDYIAGATTDVHLTGRDLRDYWSTSLPSQGVAVTFSLTGDFLHYANDLGQQDTLKILHQPG